MTSTALSNRFAGIDPLRQALATLGPVDDPESVGRALESLVTKGVLRLPVPGGGSTDGRLEALSEIAAIDLSLARLAEGHADAVAILAEAGREPRSGLYGVWAAESLGATVEAARSEHGWELRGRKRYASGARCLTRALTTARTPDGPRLFDVEVRQASVLPVHGSWNAVGMATTDSLDVVFDGVTVDESSAIGPVDFYLRRPGFWHGAVGVAACWYGGALGAYRMLLTRFSGEHVTDHQAAHVGAIAASCEAMRQGLRAAARAIDEDPLGAGGAARVRALIVRQVIEEGCQSVLTRVGRAGGTSPLAFDRSHARRAADLIVYLRQNHAEKDLTALGRTLLEAAP